MRGKIFLVELTVMLHYWTTALCDCVYGYGADLQQSTTATTRLLYLYLCSFWGRQGGEEEGYVAMYWWFSLSLSLSRRQQESTAGKKVTRRGRKEEGGHVTFRWCWWWWPTSSIDDLSNGTTNSTNRRARFCARARAACWPGTWRPVAAARGVAWPCVFLRRRRREEREWLWGFLFLDLRTYILSIPCTDEDVSRTYMNGWRKRKEGRKKEEKKKKKKKSWYLFVFLPFCCIIFCERKEMIDLLFYYVHWYRYDVGRYCIVFIILFAHYWPDDIYILHHLLYMLLNIFSGYMISLYLYMYACMWCSIYVCIPFISFVFVVVSCPFASDLELCVSLLEVHREYERDRGLAQRAHAYK